MPQGGIDKGETPRQARLRETDEETGVSADLVEVMSETPTDHRRTAAGTVGPDLNGKYGGQKQKWFVCAFRAPIAP